MIRLRNLLFVYFESSADYLYKQFRPRSDPTNTSGLIWIQPVCHYGGNTLGKYRIMKEKKQIIKQHENVRDKYQNLMYWHISSYKVFLQSEQQPL